LKTNKAINADINASINIARKVGYEVKVRQKIMSFQVTINGIKPLNPHQRANTQDPSMETPPFRTGRRSSAAGR
ncbi:MAG: hypothetical protein ACP5H6_08795, partial [Caldivirga sp.]